MIGLDALARPGIVLSFRETEAEFKGLCLWSKQRVN